MRDKERSLSHEHPPDAVAGRLEGMSRRELPATNTELALGIYRLLREASGPDDEYDIELAIIDELVEDFTLAIDFAETDEQDALARAAIASAQELRRAVMALVAAPGADG